MFRCMKDIKYYDKLEEVPFYLKDCYKRQKFLERMVDVVIFFIILSSIIRVYKTKIPNATLSNVLIKGSYLLIVVVFFIIFFMILKTEPKEYAHFIENRKLSFVPKKHLVYLSSSPPILDGYVLFLLVSTNVIPFKNYIQYTVDKINSDKPTENIIEDFVLKRLLNYGNSAYRHDGTVSQEFVDSFLAHHKQKNLQLNNDYVLKNQCYIKENEIFENNLMDVLLASKYVFKRKGRILLTTNKSNEMASNFMAYANYLYYENKLNTTEPYNALFRE